MASLKTFLDTYYAYSGSGGATSLDGLSDVSINNPTSGQVVKYNGTQWINDTGGAAGVDLTAFSVTDTGGDGSLSYNNSTGVFTYTGPSANEVRAHLSVTDAGGDGSLSYNSSTGAFTYTGPSASEVRAHFSPGAGILINSGQIAAIPYLTWQVVSTNTLCSAGSGYFVNTTLSPVTMTLPLTAAIGDTIRFNDFAGTFSTNNLTVAGNGHKIQGQTQNLVVDLDQTSFGLVYSNAEHGWKIMEL